MIGAISLNWTLDVIDQDNYFISMKHIARKYLKLVFIQEILFKSVSSE